MPLLKSLAGAAREAVTVMVALPPVLAVVLVPTKLKVKEPSVAGVKVNAPLVALTEKEPAGAPFLCPSIV